MSFKRSKPFSRSNISKQRKIKKYSYNENTVYSENVFDEIRNDPSSFRTPKKDLAKNEKLIIIKIKFKKGISELEAVLHENDFIINEFATQPTDEGIGRKTLKIIKRRLGNGFSIVAFGVTEDAEDFWKKMFEDGLIDEYIPIQSL